jgi:cyclopropane-fatty-acyl-phospholipid synthase
MNLIELAEKGVLPDAVVRLGIRRLLARRSRTERAQGSADRQQRLREFADSLRDQPLAVETDSANEQHYEVPAEFFQLVLGPRLKYSCCQFDTSGASLAEAEEAMLQQTCERAEIVDGMRVLELGCGWGSLTLWMAQHYPASHIVAVSNSASQRCFILGRAEQLGLTNVEVITADMRDFQTDQRFDRVVSVEMFEHMRNYQLLFHRVSGWLADQGKAFVHVFCHRDTPYLFEVEGADNWMGRHFFTGGMMPAEELFGCFDRELHVQQQWRVSGMHYWRTCEAWLENLDRNRVTILQRFRQDCSDQEAKLCVQRWRMFFMACGELFRYRGGDEWFVAHYLFTPRPSATGAPLAERQLNCQESS